MLMLRLARIGKKKHPLYRIVASEKSRDLYGRALEIIGHYNPTTKDLTVQKDRVTHWLSKGAQVSDTLHNLLVEKKVIEGKKKSVTHISRKKQKSKKEKKETEKKSETPKPAPAAAVTDTVTETATNTETETENKIIIN